MFDTSLLLKQVPRFPALVPRAKLARKAIRHLRVRQDTETLRDEQPTGRTDGGRMDYVDIVQSSLYIQAWSARPGWFGQPFFDPLFLVAIVPIPASL